MVDTITLLNALDSTGDPSNIGCKEADIPRLMEEYSLLFDRKQHCIVKDWKWCDVDVSEQDSIDMKEQGVKPSFVMANHIIFDQMGRFPEGGGVRTSLLSKFIPPAIFETRNTIYILTGKGTREVKSIREAGRLFM